MFVPILLIISLCFDLHIIVKCEPKPDPQLDLPPIPPASSVRPEIKINSYTGGDGETKKSDTNYYQTDERSQRFGPPYDDDVNYRDRARQNYERNNNPDFNRDRNSDYNPSYDRDRNQNYNPNSGSDRERNQYYNPTPGYDRDRNQNFNPNTGSERDRNQYYNPSFDSNPGDRTNYPYNKPEDIYSNRNPYDNSDDDRYNQEYVRKNRLETERVREVLSAVDLKSTLECSINVAAQWNFETNVNEATQEEAVSNSLNIYEYRNDIDIHLGPPFSAR